MRKFKPKPTSLCTISEQTYTVDDTGQRIRSFSDGQQVECKIQAVGRGVREDLLLGQITEDNRYVLFVGPDVTITREHKITIDNVDYKVDRVRLYKNHRGALHHKECDLQEIGKSTTRRVKTCRWQ